MEIQLQHHSLGIFRLITFRIDWFDLLSVQALSTVYVDMNKNLLCLCSPHVEKYKNA